MVWISSAFTVVGQTHRISEWKQDDDALQWLQEGFPFLQRINSTSQQQPLILTSRYFGGRVFAPHDGRLPTCCSWWTVALLQSQIVEQQDRRILNACTARRLTFVCRRQLDLPLNLSTIRIIGLETDSSRATEAHRSSNK